MFLTMAMNTPNYKKIHTVTFQLQEVSFQCGSNNDKFENLFFYLVSVNQIGEWSG